MTTLDIHDCFEPYYAGRKPFEQVALPLPALKRAREKENSSANAIRKLASRPSKGPQAPALRSNPDSDEHRAG